MTNYSSGCRPVHPVLTQDTHPWIALKHLLSAVAVSQDLFKVWQWVTILGENKKDLSLQLRNVLVIKLCLLCFVFFSGLIDELT